MAYVERALFIIGASNTGKSHQLRSLFLDRRLGRQGLIPKERNLPDTYALSNERWLYLRLTSPHENEETFDSFLNKCSDHMQPHRWNFAGPLHPTGSKDLPLTCTEVISAFKSRFEPERIRAVILSPDWSGNNMPDSDLRKLIASLQKVPTEVMVVDAGPQSNNGLMYADFFDFT